jgi:hypothetical protein
LCSTLLLARILEKINKYSEWPTCKIHVNPNSLLKGIPSARSFHNGPRLCQAMFLLLIASLLVSLSHAELISVALWTRHCATNHVKESEVLSSGQTRGDVQCLPIGLKNAELLGQKLAEKYLPPLLSSPFLSFSPPSPFLPYLKINQLTIHLDTSPLSASPPTGPHLTSSSPPTKTVPFKPSKQW